MKLAEFLKTMHELMDGARRETLGSGDRIVFVSDLHLGDRSGSDDFRRNEDLVLGALSSHYRERNYRLVLNGDIEELHKFRLSAVRSAYSHLFDLFRDFAAGPGLVKIVGNHNLPLLLLPEDEFPRDHALRLDWNANTILAFHGHQSHKLFTKYNYISNFIVRYLANPLHLHNVDIPMTSARRFRAEKRIYRASKQLGIVSIAGHTHRPLFESYSKYDTLRWNIETMLRRYTLADETGKSELSQLISIYADEFRRLGKRDRTRKVSRSLYEREELLYPCMFNSGCLTGRGGFTAIEIADGTIALVYWARDGAARNYVEKEAQLKERASGTPWIKYTIASDSLDYVFARIQLLG
ncbi:MAG: hypothetical protein JW923_11340 [Spirochaetales bacterium]|nr:hypothetical protein [Spirochaetales bacterium]